MTFVEAAVALLQEASQPMPVDELARLAVERELLSRPGKNPLRSMKARLTTELKKGDASRVVKAGPDLWELAGNGAADAAGAPAADPDEQLDEVLAPKETVVRAGAPKTPEEEALEEIYGDELEGTEPGEAYSEYRDARTADEDRPMLPEITATKRERGRRDRRARARERMKERQRGRRSRRERPRGKDKAARSDDGAKDAASAASPGSVSIEIDEGDGIIVHRPGNALGDGAFEALDSLKNEQPVQVKQLAQMMRKRNLLDGDPNEVWPHLKASLLADERSYREHGLRPRITYQGRDLFKIERGAGGAADAERALGNAIVALAKATHAELWRRLGAMSPVSLERLVHIFLLRRAWRDIQWIKRVPHASYALAQPAAGPGPLLVSACTGDEEIPRRGVGELRAGVEAKDLPAGYLLAPRDLSEDAAGELEREGKPISVLCGHAFVAELIGAGVGVVTGHARIHLLDDELLDELAE